MDEQELMGEMLDRFESLQEDEGMTEAEALAIVADEFPDQVALLAELIPAGDDDEDDDPLVGLYLLDEDGDEE